MRNAPANQFVTEPALLSALADPRTYGGVPVTVHETHASWVFVAGERAYKIKKPVSLGFLDYSTLELRRAACLEEVRLNHELAPDIYLGVREILRTESGFELSAGGSAGEVVEHAVEMRSFDEGDTLAGLIASGEMTPRHIDAVATRLAAFHRHAPIVSDGRPARLLELWQRNVAELESADVPGRLPTVTLEGFAEAFVAMHEQELRCRAQEGLVRDVHGDLRCEHVLAVPSVRFLDRIEFDPSLRQTDIAADLAFLAMDLEAHERPWAAERLLASYRDKGMDPGGDALLSFYAAHRALVRAKVDLIAASESGEGRRRTLVAKADSMWTLAERLSWRARAPVAIVVCGPPASGKSTLARELADRSGFELLSSDEIRKSEAGLKPTDRASAEHYSHRVTHHVYELLAARATERLDRRAGVIVDATCGSRIERSTLLGRLVRTGAPRLVVHCEIPLEIALQRAERRSRDPARVSDAEPSIVLEQYRSFEALEELPPGDVLTLDTRPALDAQAIRVTHSLDRLLRVRASAPGGPGS